MIVWSCDSVLSKNYADLGKEMWQRCSSWYPPVNTPGDLWKEQSPSRWVQVLADVQPLQTPRDQPWGLAVSRAAWRGRCLTHRVHHSSSTTSTESHQGNEPSLTLSLELEGAFPKSFWGLWWFRNNMWCISVIWGFGSGTDLKLLRLPGGKLCFLGVIIYPEHLCRAI